MSVSEAEPGNRVFMMITGHEGSTAWLEIENYSQLLARDGYDNTGFAQITRNLDDATAKFIQLMAAGTDDLKVDISVWRDGALNALDRALVEVAHYRMEGVRIVDVDPTTARPDEPVRETISLTFERYGEQVNRLEEQYFTASDVTNSGFTIGQSGVFDADFSNKPQVDPSGNLLNDADFDARFDDPPLMSNRVAIFLEIGLPGAPQALVSGDGSYAVAYDAFDSYFSVNAFTFSQEEGGPVELLLGLGDAQNWTAIEQLRDYVSGFGPGAQDNVQIRLVAVNAGSEGNAEGKPLWEITSTTASLQGLGGGSDEFRNYKLTLG